MRFRNLLCVLGAAALALLCAGHPGAAAETTADLHPPIPVNFSLTEPGFVTLVIEDAQGRRVRNLIADTRFEAGKHTLWWDGANDWGDMVEGLDGIYQPQGTLVSPGTYHVRGIVHQQIDLRYQFTPNSPGTPPWVTDDRSGNWTADHTPPCEALFLPGDTPQVLIGSAVAEGGDGLIFVNMDGKKVRGMRWINGVWTGAQYMARDRGPNPLPDVLTYAGAGWTDDTAKLQGQIRLTTITSTVNREIVKYAVKTEPREDDKTKGKSARLAGLAVYNGLLVAALGDTNELLVVQVKEPKKNRRGEPGPTMQQETLGTIPLAGVRYLTFDRQGRLLVLTKTGLSRYTLTLNPLALSAPQTLISAGLEDPQRMTLDDKDAIYISDWGNSQQVKLFTPEGKFIRAIGTPGVQKVGPYDPTHMNHPNGIAVDGLNRIWVAETDFLPKRVSIWTMDGKLVKGLVGPPDYGAGGEMDPQDRTRFYYADYHAGTMEFRLDWENRTYEVSRIIYRPTGDELQLSRPGGKSGYVNPQTPLYYQGRQYMTNLFNTSPTELPKFAGIWIMREGRAYLVAAAGDAYYWDRLLEDEQYTTCWPKDYDVARARKSSFYRNDNDVLAAWSDRNNDGKMQPDEVTMRRVENNMGVIYVTPELSFVTTRGYSMKPQSVTADGVPIYDATTAQSTISDPVSLKTPGADLLTTPDGWHIIGSGPVKGYKDGKLVWTYPNGWPSLHWGHHAPPVQYPGMLIATTKIIGYPVTPRGAQNVQLWGYNGDPGQIYLMTTDGLFLTMLFKDGKGAKFPDWRTLHDNPRDMLLNDFTVAGENFWPRLVQTNDGQVYVITGKSNSSIVRVDGLNTIKRFTGSDVIVTAAMLQQVNAYFVQRDASRQAAAGTGTMQVALRATAPKVDGKLDEWAKADWVKLDDIAQAAVCVAGDRLYAAFRTQDRSLLTNTGEMPIALFKCGGALDLMISTNPQADPKRGKPVAGDLRLLITLVKGKPVATLYRPVVPGTKEPVPFSSPWRTITIDRVDDVSAQVALASGKLREDVMKNGKVTTTLNWEEYECSFPLAALGLTPQAGQQISGDIGILRGNGGETAQRLYWHNKSTGIVNDVPGEAVLTPQLWGRWQFVPEAAN